MNTLVTDNDLEVLNEFVKRYKKKGDAAKALGMSISQLSSYLHGFRKVGATVREKLREHGYYQDQKRGWDLIKNPPERQEITGNTNMLIPMMMSAARAGEPSYTYEGTRSYMKLADYYNDSTYMIRVTGESMIMAGITEGDWLVVDSSKEPYNNCIVVARIGDGCVVKRFKKNGESVLLHPENKRYKPIPIDQDNVEILGVVIMMQKFF